MSRVPLVLLASASLLLSAQPAPAAEPAPAFATVEGTCTTTDSTIAVVESPPVDRALVRVTIDGGPARIRDVPVADGEIVWMEVTRFVGAMSASVDCTASESVTTYRLDFHAVPTPPFTIRGRGGAQSSLPFSVSRRGAVAADLEVTGGRVALTANGARLSPFGPGSTSLELGTAEEGTPSIGVSADPGTVWALGLRALPAKLSDLRLGAAIPAGTAGVTGQFTLDRPARVQVTVHDGRGAAVDWPLTPRDLDGGTFAVGWDGRTLPGSDAGDGRYELRVRSEDATGTVSELSGPILVDRAAPTVSLRRSSLGVRDAVVARATDQPGGIASLTASTGTPARVLAAEPGAHTVTVPAPAGGWRIGTHTMKVVAVDHAGNRVSRTLTFVAQEVSGLPCGRDAAIDRVLNTARVAAALGKTRAARGRSVAATYRISRVLCADLDGDHVREMAVLLRAREAGEAPTPLVVFRARPGQQYVPRVLSTRHRIRGLVARGRRLEGRVPGGRQITVRNAGGTLVLRVR